MRRWVCRFFGHKRPPTRKPWCFICPRCRVVLSFEMGDDFDCVYCGMPGAGHRYPNAECLPWPPPPSEGRPPKESP